MEKVKKGKSSSKKANKNKPAFKLNNREKTAFIGLIVLVILVILILSLSCTREKNTGTAYEAKKDEPQFVREGELFFIESETGDTIKNIAIEIADNDKERNQGMMYRSQMPDTAGMLFIYEQPREQSFWMKDTPLSLDILYVDANGEIVTLYKNTTPYSEKSIPSYKKAQYVVEVVGGFTDRYEISVGDKIGYIKNNSSGN